MKSFIFGALGALLLGGVIGCGETSEPPAAPAETVEESTATDDADTVEEDNEAAPAEGAGTTE